MHPTYIEGHDAVEQALQDQQRTIISCENMHNAVSCMEFKSNENIVDQKGQEVKHRDIKSPSSG